MNSLSHAIKVATWASMTLLLSACGSQTESTQMPPAPEVSVAQVVSERLTEWDTFTGRLEAPQSVELRPRVSGYVDIVAYEEGAIVKAGDPLFFIDNRAYKAEVKRLEAALKTAKARFVLAESEFARAQDLVTQNAISIEQLDQRLAQYQEAEANIAATQASLELARLELSYTRVEAPIAGRVSRALVTKGNYVNAGQSVLTNLVSVGKVYAYFDADERTYLNYAKLNKEGARPSSRNHKNPVLMGLASDQNFPYQGHIDFVDNQINPSSGTIRGRAVFDNEQGDLIPGLFARLKLVGSAAYQGILIDDKAIGTDLNNKFVLVLSEDNTVQYRAITLGDKFNGLRIVKSGLSIDDKIVVNGLQRVRPGTPVTPKIVTMTTDAKLTAIRHAQHLLDTFAVTAKDKSKIAATQQAPDSVVGG
ncbi:efflux RND transporter periplasmic adaptor subunit [Alteromonas sediminis]|uniref:Efflux RND transporter periplasmic adaptor subunit n=1 Tax=Alteromonas sediminis TaxID=2259342 RepID=A0A3N5Y4M5_9ALTE|nr:efflux RND transporter periplasmic adaptor subunit [Alteromonas sediminis]RPJ68103.1 efflux RND transporter periplasmic adaptor subunit [Alteromonas sediminis]